MPRDFAEQPKIPQAPLPQEVLQLVDVIAEINAAREHAARAQAAEIKEPSR